MKAEQRDRLLEAADRASKDINGLGLQETLAEGHRMFSRLAEIFDRVKTREQVIELFDSFPDMSRTDERLFIFACRYAKHFFRLGAIAMAAKIKSEFPKPPGGRNRVFKRNEEIEVCELVGDLLMKKVELQFAYQRAAAHFDVSSRSIRRIWEDRDEIAQEVRDPDFNTTLAAVKTFLLDESS